MSYIKVDADAAGNPINIFYQDWGQGNPVVLIHGWPVDHQMWEYQMTELPRRGLRVVAYDRRGFGKSSKPWESYDYDTLADDLKAVLDELDLQNVTLVGFSMGGGEVARYMSRHHGARVARVAFVGAVTPFLLQTDNNPDGIPKAQFDTIYEGIQHDRAEFFLGFGKQFFGMGLLNKPISQGTLDWHQGLTMISSPKATLDCLRSFSETDFRADLPTIKVPTLIIHGDADQTVPIKISGDRTAELLPQAEYKVYKGAPHGLFITEKEQLTRDLLTFAGR